MADKKKTDKLEKGYVVKTVDDLFDNNKDITTRMLHRIVFRNILYYLGEQWMSWAPNSNVFKRSLKKDPLPTPVSNIIRDYVRSMKALILNKDFKVSIWPNSEDMDDAVAAKLGEALLEDLEAANDEEFLDEKEKVAMWTVLAGTTFMRTFPMLDRGEWFVDARGDMVKTGEVACESVSLFSVIVDNLGDNLKSKRWAGIQSVKPREWVEDTFKVILPADQQDETVNYQKRLMKMVANVSPWKKAGLESLSDVDDDDTVIFREVEYKPDSQYRNGRYVATSCGTMLFAHDKMPIPVKKGKWEYTLTDFHYYYVPGRFWSDAGVNDLISPQNTINQIDQALEINRNSLGRNMVALGSDVELTRLTKYGEHLLVLKYDTLLSGGAKPEFKQGIPLPSQVLDERNIHRQVAQEAAGDPKNVLRGQSPSSQASGVMVDTLREAAEQGHYPDILRFYRALKRVKRKQLIIARELYTEDRVIKIAGKGKKPEIKTFNSAKLRDNTDVRLELSSGMSSTKTGQVQMFLKLIEAGFFSNEANMEPEFREDLLRRMGLSGFTDKTNTHVLRAQGENALIARAEEEKDYSVVKIRGADQDLEIPFIPDIFLTMNDPSGTPEIPKEPIVLSEDLKFKYDNHHIHYDVHSEYILSSEFKEMGESGQYILIGHTDIHKIIMENQMQQEMERRKAMEEEEQN